MDVPPGARVDAEFCTKRRLNRSDTLVMPVIVGRGSARSFHSDVLAALCSFLMSGFEHWRGELGGPNSPRTTT